MSIPACSSAEPFVAFNVKKKYDVFLSFRGPDTREGFVKKLYSALVRAGIQTFLDQIYLDKGEHVFSYLCESISASRICIPIFSSNFAQSKWCLKEVLHMIESDVRICPLFYDVLPSDLRDGGKYEEDFRQHRIQQTLSTELIKECQSALQTVSNRCGWSSDQFFGEEGDLIQDVVSGIEKELHFDLNSPDKVLNSPVKVYLDTPKCFGLEWSVEHVRRLLNVADHQKIGRVGIHGMGGIGKTTLAKLVYKLLYSQFEASCFVLDVGGRCEDANGLVKLQTQMLKDVSKFKGEVDHVDRGKGLLKESLRGKKVLLLLDDLRSPEQLEALAGNYSDFGAGSRLIITSRDQQVLKVANADEVYDVRRLPHRHALQLFDFHAFPKSSCSDDQELETLGNNIVSACDGLPLALQLLGNSLVGERDKNVWVDTVDKLTREPYLQKKLRTCYDTLDSYEKEMFQDVACFFKWSTDKEIAMIFWGELIRSPHASLRHLLQKSLVNLGSGNELRMHSCLQDLGRSIANEMSSEPRKRTRLFEEDDVQHVLWRPWEKASRPCYLSYEPNECKILKAEMFKSLYNLQLLWLTDVVIESHFSEAYFQDLRWLRWRRCLSKSLPLGMNLKSLVILEVTDSQITNIWDDRTGRLQNMPPLKLKVLILSGCTFLEKLPATFTYAQLQILDLRNCHSLRALPNTVGNFSSLVSLNMEGCGVSSLPEDFGELSRLQELNLSWCKHLCKLPPSFGNLTQLKRLQIHHNPRLTELPESIGGLKALLYLNASYCQLSDDGLPAGISELSSLRIIHLEHNGLRSLPSDFQKLSALWELHLDGCKHLSLLPPLPLSLEMLFARDCLRLDTLCCLSDLKSLSRLDVSKSLHLAELPGLESLQGLTSLKLVGCKSISSRTLESCLGGLKSLESVIIGGPGVSRTQLQSFYVSIKGISFEKQCLLSTPDVTSNWVKAEAEAGRRKGEEMKCLDYSENKVNYCAGYIVCCVSFGQNWSRLEASTRRLRYTIEREDNLRPCEVIHPQMEGGDPNILEVRVVRVEGDEDFEWLRRGYKVRVNACSDYENWRACFKFLMYEPVHAGYPRVQENPPHTIIFGV